MIKQGSMRTVRRLAVVAIVAVATACSPLVRTHGYIPVEDDLARIQVGQDTRESVRLLVGPPTSGGVLREGNFYYVASTFRTSAVFAPEEVNREVLAISFDDAGIVRNIERFGLEDGQVVALSRRVTDTGIADTTFVSQLLSSLGRIDPGQFLGSGN